jgi:cytochrome c oxidase subunit 4
MSSASEHVPAHAAPHGHGEDVGHAHPGPRTYVIVGVVLAVITLLEVYAYTAEAIRPILVPILLVLSATKFVLVVGFYMHLRFDAPLFTGVFGFGLAVAGSVITALLFLFGQYPFPIHHE